ncbi:hypothetical protein ABZ215_17550 [Amycolatopsis sp. NPDC006131]|uniref:hypothetical protein n=1 Tax=Amycolatopsis sp. NPDC006131 TaxID=3156731 RepID=UPI0033AC4AD5
MGAALIDLSRALPKEYDEEFHSRSIDLEDRAELTSAYITARNLGPYATPESIAPLLADLPVMVLRDILAAKEYRERGEPGSWQPPSDVRRAGRVLGSLRSPNESWQQAASRGCWPRPRPRAQALEPDITALLPETERLLPLPKAADVEVLRQRHRHWKDRLRQSVPQLDRLLFTLPGAI